jgi:hypothetical protein
LVKCSNEEAMKIITMMLFVFIISGCASKQETSSDDVREQMKYSVVFSITPNAEGDLEKIGVSLVRNLHTKEKVDMSFSPEFISSAKRKMSRAKWNVSHDEAGIIKDVYMFCFYSEAVPDSPVCDASYGE